MRLTVLRSSRMVNCSSIYWAQCWIVKTSCTSLRWRSAHYRPQECRWESSSPIFSKVLETVGSCQVRNTYKPSH